MLRKTAHGFLTVMALLLTAGTGAATTITFDAVHEVGPAFKLIPSPYSEAGFVFTATTGGLETWRTLGSGWAGSAALINDTDLGIITVTKADSGTFSLLSIDISEVFGGVGQSVSVTFTGTRPDTSTVQQTHVLDGSHGMETFVFSGFTDLASVSWVQEAEFNQVDNVVFFIPIPEPAPGVLLGLGLLAFAGRKRR
ncbi:MAG: PEP-CTERM sorting domain-containing protein [Myxococcota bacterium]